MADILDVLRARALAGERDGDIARRAQQQEGERGNRERDKDGKREALQRKC